MEYLVNLLVFEIIYIFLYMVPSGILLGLYTIFISGLLPDFISTIILIALYFIFLIMFFFSSYRANIAAKCKVANDMKLFQAHSASWAIVKTNLSFLPIIGFLFESRD